MFATKYTNVVNTIPNKFLKIVLQNFTGYTERPKTPRNYRISTNNHMLHKYFGTVGTNYSQTLDYQDKTVFKPTILCALTKTHKIPFRLEFHAPKLPEPPSKYHLQIAAIEPVLCLTQQ